MRLSVVVPVYNKKEYISKCVDSILGQSYTDMELILVDDGSTDESGKICDDYARIDERVKVIHKENSGPLLSRKRGVEESTGEYITFVDADDFVSEKSFELAIPDMNRNIDIIAFGIIRYYNDEYLRRDHDFFDEGIYFADQIKKSIYPNMIWNEKRQVYGLDPSLCNKIFKGGLLKEYYLKIIQMENIHYGEDIMILYPFMIKVNSLSIHHNAYYYHRQRATGELADYIIDDKFFDKLYVLYSYLMDVFEEKEIFRRQIELFYMKSVMLKGKQYGQINYFSDKLFPFDKVKKGERIVLYGAGDRGRVFKRQVELINYCELVLWVDRNYAQLGEKDIVDPEEIFKNEFDHIIITLMNQNSVKSVIDWLIMKGIPRDKVIIDV